jgi:very-short-patch-repair endonuclease
MGLASWLLWAAEAGYRPSIQSGEAIGQLVPMLVEHIGAHCDLPRLALNALLRRACRPPTASTSSRAAPLDGRTLADLDALAAPILCEADPSGTAVVAHEICRLALKGELVLTDLSRQLDARLSDRADAPLGHVLQALDELVPIGACPAVLLTVKPIDKSAEAAGRHGINPIESIATALAHLSQTVPTWPVAMAMSSAEFERYQRAAPDSQAKSLVTTGVISTPMSSSGRQFRPRRKVGKSVARREPATDEMLDAETRASASAADAARSDAERLLFQMLESNPTTRGHFVPNGSPGFNFGPRQAEVDLLASDLRLAVEIDGYFHFTHPDAYRRDRRKDWLLQSHGYTVVRVLAEDVAARMENILDFLVSVVENRCRAADSERQ